MPGGGSDRVIEYWGDHWGRKEKAEVSVSASSYISLLALETL